MDSDPISIGPYTGLIGLPAFMTQEEEEERGGWRRSFLSESQGSRARVRSMSNKPTGIAEGWELFIKNHHKDSMKIIPKPETTAQRFGKVYF